MAPMKTGRPHRGERRQIPLRIPTELHERIVQDAERLGVPKSDIVWAMVATSYRRKDLLPDTMRPRDTTDATDQQQRDERASAA